MIGAGSLPSHARAKRDKPQFAQGQRGDTWVPDPSVVEDTEALQEGEKQAADLADSSPKLLHPGRALFQGQVQQVLAGTLHPCKHHNPELQKISKWTDISVPGLIQLLPLTLDTVFLEPLIQTFHPGNTSSGQPLSKLDALLPQSHTVSSLDIQLDRPY